MSKPSDFASGQNLTIYDLLPPQSDEYNMVLLRSHIRGMCNGDHCAGFLLEYLLFFHKQKVATAISEKKSGSLAADRKTAHDAGIFDQWHTKEGLQAQLGGLYGKNSLVDAERLLCELGYIRKYKKPYNKYTDNTTHYHINDDVLQACETHYWECRARGEVAVFAKNDTWLPFEKGQTTVLIQTGDRPKTNEHSQGTPTRYTSQGIESTTTGSCRDEGQNPPSSGHSYSANHLAVNQALNATGSNTNTHANSRQRKPRRPPAPLPSHPAIPFMQELARTLAPVLASPAHAEYPSEGVTAFKYHTDALEAYDAIQTGAIMARTIDRPERYTDLTIWGNDFRLAQLKQWAKDPKAMESALLSAARIFATSRAKNATVAKLPTVAAFLFGSTTSGGFLPWWSAIKPVEAMEAKEKQILKEADLEEKSKPRFLELEEKNRIEQNSYMHETFVKLFGREPKQFKETK